MLIGIESMISRLGRIQQSIPTANEDALKKIAKEIMKVAVARTPVETGALVRSAAISDPKTVGNKTSVIMSFGGSQAANVSKRLPFYAVYVHENTLVHHNPPTRSKFLESAVLESASHVGGQIAHEILQAWMVGTR